MGKRTFGAWLAMVLVFGFNHKSSAQSFGPAVFDQLPRNFQLYARNDSNQAAVPISGAVNALGYRSVSVVVYRNKQPTAYLSSPLTYAGKYSVVCFNFNPKIKAELADYDFAVYVRRDSADSTLVLRRDDIVAGDFYVLHGQSNAISVKLDAKDIPFFEQVLPDRGAGSRWRPELLR